MLVVCLPEPTSTPVSRSTGTPHPAVSTAIQYILAGNLPDGVLVSCSPPSLHRSHTHTHTRSTERTTPLYAIIRTPTENRAIAALVFYRTPSLVVCKVHKVHTTKHRHTPRCFTWLLSKALRVITLEVSYYKALYGIL